MKSPRKPIHGERPDVGQLPIDEDVRKELDFHIEMRTEEFVQLGWDPAAAHQEAERRFGSMSEFGKECREITASKDRATRRAHMLDAVYQDLQYAFRTLGKTPALTAVAILTLALGLGANAAIFSVVNGVLFRPLALPEPGELVWIDEWRTQAGAPMGVAGANVADWREQSRTMAGIARFAGGPTTVLGGEEPMRLSVVQVGEEFWDVFPVRPVTGRTTTAQEHLDPPQRVALLREDTWRTRFAAQDIREIDLEISGNNYTVIGVLPADFDFPNGAEVWGPAAVLSTSRTAHNWRAVGRLGSGVSVEQADAELDAIQGRIAAARETDPDFLGDAVRVLPLQERLVGASRGPLLLLLGAAVLVLLIACTNLASTLLAKGAGRMREMAVRSALGAERKRLVRQLMTESLVLSAAGGLAGIAIAIALVRTLKAMAPATVPRLDEVGMDLGTLGFMGAIVLGTAVLFGLPPALRVARSEVAAVLRSGGRGSAGDRHGRVWDYLVGSEVALAFILLTGSGLLIRSFQQVAAIELGFETEGVVTTPIDLSRVRYPTGQDYARFYTQFIDELEANPAIARAGVGSSVPVSGSLPNGRVELDGDMSKQAIGGYVAASAGYFEVFDIPLRAGRLFDERDGPDGGHVAIVNQSFANEYWPGESAVGKQVTGGGMDSFWRERRFATVVGVVGDVRYGSLTELPEGVIYFPYSQRPQRLRFQGTLVVKSQSGEAGPAISATRSTLERLDPDVPPRFRTMDQYMRSAVDQRRFTMSLFGAFAIVALALAVVGIYGVVSYSVARRTREMGVRIALGADPIGVQRLVLGTAMRPVLLGSVVGIVGAFLGSRLIEAMLFGISSSDPVTFAIVGITLVTAGLLASMIPARRSTRVDPMVTMQAE